jgi:mono/diheme cytochrome c family protein
MEAGFPIGHATIDNRHDLKRRKPMQSYYSYSVGLLWVAATGLVTAADVQRGQQLYENHCTECHASQVHIREQRKAATLATVRWQIVRWQEVLQLPWTATEVDDVQAYLNAQYYHYESN